MMQTKAPGMVLVDLDRAKTCEQLHAGSFATSFYYPQLDGLRTLAFLLAFGSHAGGFTASQLPALMQGPVILYNNLVSFGWCGVDLFFVLSAFLITSLLLREEKSFIKIDYKSFIVRRALRIWPLYFLMVFLGMALFPWADPAVLAGGNKFGPAFFSHYVWTNFAWSLTFTLNLGVAWNLVFAPANLLPLWSISLEEQFYLVWPLFLKVVKSTPSRLILLFAMLVACISYRWYLMQVYPGNHVPYYLNTLTRLDPLVFGALVAFTLHCKPSLIRAGAKFGYLWFVASLTIFQATTSANRHMFEEQNPFALTLFAIAWACFLIGMLCWQPAIKVFSNRWLAAFGRLTYGMYVFHALVINIIFNQLVPRLGFGFPTNESDGLALFLGLPITFVLAWCSWNFYEKRFHKLKDKFARVKSGYHSVAARS